MEMRVRDFVDEVSRDTPAPGGGSIAALAGSLGAALASMVANITHAKIEGDAEKEAVVLRIAAKAQAAKDKLLAAVDDDTDAFNAYLEALRLRAGTPAGKGTPRSKNAGGPETVLSKFPMELRWPASRPCSVPAEIALHGHPASITDAAVGCEIALVGVRGGVWNVLTNLQDIRDPNYVREMREKCHILMENAKSCGWKMKRTQMPGSADEQID